jgi:Zn-dependent protease
MPDFSPQLLAFGFVWYVAFLFSTTCHEAAHAFVAKLGGDDTAALGGQVTLNPVPHIQREPISFTGLEAVFGTPLPNLNLSTSSSAMGAFGVTLTSESR